MNKKTVSILSTEYTGSDKGWGDDPHPWQTNDYLSVIMIATLIIAVVAAGFAFKKLKRLKVTAP